MKVVQIAGLFCLASIFAFNSITFLREPEKQADKFFKQYADFRIWSNKKQRSLLGGSTLLEFPSSEKVKPYKLKAGYIIAYCNLLGAVGMVIGEQMMILPLILVHLFTTFVKFNPFNVQKEAEQVKYDNNMRAFLINIAIMFGLIIVFLEKHPLGGEAKSHKV